MLALLGILGVSLLATGGLATLVHAGEPPQVVVLLSQDAEPYRQVLAGLQQSIRQHRPDVTLVPYSLGGEGGRTSIPLPEGGRSRPRVVVTLGTLATQMAVRANLSAPVVAALIPSAADLARAANATGVVLEFPLQTHFQWMRRFFPAARTIGVMYNPGENQKRVEAATQVAARHGFVLEAEAVQAPRDLPVALETLAKRIEVLWGLADSLVLNPETARQILLHAFRARIPLVGPSAGWVKAGALYALHWDYHDLGFQSGELVIRALRDMPPGGIPVVPPRRVLYSVNQRTALHMKIELPETLIRGAHEVF